MNILGLISQLIGIKTLRLTYIYSSNPETKRRNILVSKYSVSMDKPKRY